MGNTNKTGLNKSDTINWNTESMTTTDNPKSDINNNIQKLVANLKLENNDSEFTEDLLNSVLSKYAKILDNENLVNDNK